MRGGGENEMWFSQENVTGRRLCGGNPVHRSFLARCNVFEGREVPKNRLSISRYSGSGRLGEHGL